jgi:hypothetical protein
MFQLYEGKRWKSIIRSFDRSTMPEDNPAKVTAAAGMPLHCVE